jgi:hypothetical protein
LIGIDYFLGKRDGIYPFATDLMSHNCVTSSQLYEFLNPNLSGQSFGPFVETMIERSQGYMMRGKTILVLNRGGASKSFILESAEKDQIKIVLVDNFPEEMAPKVSRYIRYDSSDHSRDELHAEKIVEILRKQEISIDGCCTFWEDSRPLAALICDRMGLTGVGVEGAKIAKNKCKTHQALSCRTGNIPHFPKSSLYAEKCV